MLNDDFIKKASLEIEKYYQILLKRKGITGTKLQDDIETMLLVARALELSIQALLDIGAHILSAIGTEPWTDYADIPRLLAKYGVLSEHHKALFITMAGMRNVLAHEYITLDADKVAAVINNHLEDILTILSGYHKYLGLNQ